jgi:hypothetical protein
LLLVLLGAWGALIPFIGPYFNYAYTPDDTWHYTAGRLILQILPGVGAALGGLLVMGSANRVAAMFGGWLAAVSGAWFIVGVPLSALWGSPTIGDPTGDTTRRVWEYIGFFGGLGAVIVFLAAFALGRFAVVGVKETERFAQQRAVVEEGDTMTPAEDVEDEEVRAGRGPFHWHGSRHAGAR